MKINVIKLRRRSFMLAMVMVLTALFSACVNLDDVPEVDPNEILGDTSIDSNVATEDEIPVEGNETEAPKNITMVNITPDVVAIYGTCENGAVVTVTGGKEDVSTNSFGEYFIVQTTLERRGQNLLKLTAQVKDKDVSKEREVIAKYDATAENRLDGNSVSIGNDSKLYFDKMLEDFKGNESYSATQLNAIRDSINENITEFKMVRAGSQQVEMIYVLLPNATSVDPSVFPAGAADSKYSTAYDDINKTIGGGNTQAKVVDMKSIFLEALKDEETMKKYGGIFRTTDSNLTDYGSYLTYKAIMEVVKQNEKFKDIEIKDVEKDFAWNSVTAQGGNLVDYRGFDDEFINEKIVVSTPNFSLDVGTDKKISDGIKYKDPANGDYDYFTGEEAKNSAKLGLSEHMIITTDRKELPTALIYRDDAAIGFSDILAERFEQSSVYATGQYKVNLGMTETYKAEGDNTVDYVIVVISEENMTSPAFKDAFGIQ